MQIACFEVALVGSHQGVEVPFGFGQFAAVQVQSDQPLACRFGLGTIAHHTLVERLGIGVLRLREIEIAEQKAGRAIGGSDRRRLLERHLRRRIVLASPVIGSERQIPVQRCRVELDGTLDVRLRGIVVALHDRHAPLHEVRSRGVGIET